MKYAEKLKDPRWQKLRLKIFERDGFKCLACGAGDRPLNVHHLAYHYEPWDAPKEELETLCEECHGNIESAIVMVRRNARLKFLPYAIRSLIAISESSLALARKAYLGIKKIEEQAN